MAPAPAPMQPKTVGACALAPPCRAHPPLAEWFGLFRSVRTDRDRHDSAPRYALRLGARISSPTAHVGNISIGSSRSSSSSSP
eukprot:2120274-Alexandrium_andersonii.AAC.1